jgi:DNA mismatch repair protein MutS
VAKTLFATHYHELIDLAAFLPRVRNYHVAVAEEGGRIVFLHRVLPGGADGSYGVQVAELAGLPRPVVARGQELLQEMERRDALPPSRRRRRSKAAVQLPLDADGLGLLQELAALDVDSPTPPGGHHQALRAAGTCPAAIESLIRAIGAARKLNAEHDSSEPQTCGWVFV